MMYKAFYGISCKGLFDIIEVTGESFFEAKNSMVDKLSREHNVCKDSIIIIGLNIAE